MDIKINQACDNYDRVTEEYIVAFVDILGITNKIRSANSNDSLNLVHNLYSFFKQIIYEIAIPENQELKIKIFSDNILIARKLSSNDKKKRCKEIKCLLMAVSHFQNYCIGDSVGYLVRGGITIGKLFIDDIMVFGEALVNAYNLESKIATYPRIVIDSKTMSEINQYDELKTYIQKDFDDMDFLNSLSIWKYCGKLLMDGFEKIKKEASLNLNERILQNLNWHKNFINRQLEIKGETFRLYTDDLLISK